MHLAISNRFRAGLLALLMALLGVSAAVVATPGKASAAPLAMHCTTLNLSPGTSLGFSITPHMTAPVCYTGATIWQSGPITPGVVVALATQSLKATTTTNPSDMKKEL